MIFKRMNDDEMEKMPTNCAECKLSSRNSFIYDCKLPRGEYGSWIDKYDGKKHERCPLIELIPNDIDFLLRAAQTNRNNSAYLAELPEQRWREAHKTEVEIMDKLIHRLEIIKKVLEQQLFLTDDIREVYVKIGEEFINGVPVEFIEVEYFWETHDSDDGYVLIYLNSENKIIQ